MRILHVDHCDDRYLEMVLTCRNHELVVHYAEDGDEAISILVRDPYEVAIVAPGLQDFEGCELIRRLRACRVHIPIILLGDRTTPEYRARALWDGADDVLDLPWARDEMVARIKSLARRSHGHSSGILKVGPLIVDQERMRVLRVGVGGGMPIAMTEKEYLLLELLAMRAGRVCTKQQIMDHLYGGRDEPEEKIIDVFVCKIRRKLGELSWVIGTVWGRGYLLRTDQPSPAYVAA
jgi:two-component system cell cycle response regulator CtrA